jgi:hypothetical protein
VSGLRGFFREEGDAMVKRVGLLVIVIALGLAVLASAGQGTGKISGTARNAQGQVLPNVKVQLRNIDTGQLVATSRAGADGAFEFTGLNPGNYVVEVVDDSGRIIGLSPSTALAAGGAVTNLVVAASAAGTLAGAVATAGGVGGFFTTTGGIFLLTGLAAGVTAGIIAANQEASPSR